MKKSKKENDLMIYTYDQILSDVFVNYYDDTILEFSADVRRRSHRLAPPLLCVNNNHSLGVYIEFFSLSSYKRQTELTEELLY